MIVDPQPKARHKRFDAVVLQALESMAQGTPPDLLLQAALALGPALSRDVILRSRLEPVIAETALQELIASGQLIILEDMMIPASQWAALAESLLGIVTAFHQTFPLRQGIPREELKSRLKLSPRIFNLILHRLASEGILTEAPKWAALPDHQVRFSPFQQVKVDKLLAQFAAAPLAPPSVKDCQAEAGEDIFNTLLEFGDLVAVSVEVVFRKNVYDSMVEKVIQVTRQNGKVTLAEVRDLLNTSRRYTQALLEHMDATGVTVREGDYRRLKV